MAHCREHVMNLQHQSLDFRSIRGLFFVLFVLADGAAAQSTDINSQQLILEADRFRGHIEEGIEYKVDLACTTETGPTARTYLVRSKGEGASALTQSPPDHKGDLYLVNGRSIWDLRVTSKQPVAISLASRMTGLASVGDIVAMGFGSIYDSVSVGKETLDGQENHKFELTAKREQRATYETAWMWINEKTKLATQVQFLSIARKPIKTVTFAYESKLLVNGKEMPFISASKVTDLISSCTLRYYDAKTIKIEPEEFDIEKVATKRQVQQP